MDNGKRFLRRCKGVAAKLVVAAKVVTAAVVGELQSQRHW